MGSWLSLKDENGTLLVGMLAEQESEFRSKESQLIAYLTILREHRSRAGKSDTTPQGFYTDGAKFGFVSIEADGRVLNSHAYEICFEGELNIVYGFFITMLDTAMNNTHTATPTKPAAAQDTQIDDDEGEKEGGEEDDDDEWFEVEEDIDEEQEQWSEINNFINESLGSGNDDDVYKLKSECRKLMGEFVASELRKYDGEDDDG